MSASRSPKLNIQSHSHYYFLLLLGVIVSLTGQGDGVARYRA